MAAGAPFSLLGVPVSFPPSAPPYAAQMRVMETAIRAMHDSSSALLESPTGTGKTRALLCATLAWVQWKAKQQGEGAGGKHVVVYASRTHAQLVQVAKELGRTPYRPKTSALGARTQCCVHPSVTSLEASHAKDVACRKLVSARSCRHHLAVEPYLAANPSVGGAAGPVDIEELVRLGNSDPSRTPAAAASEDAAAVERTAAAVFNKRSAASTAGPCPFYLGRELARSADIIFVPYNYLIDDTSRQALADLVPWEGAVVIFDEAHNVGSAAAEAASFEFPASLLSAAIRESERAVELSLQRLELGGAGDGVDVDWNRRAEEFRLLKQLLVSFERAIADALKDQPPPQKGGKPTGVTKPAEWLFDKLLPAAIPGATGSSEDGDTLPFFIAQLELGAAVLAESALASGAPSSVGGKLQQLADTLKKSANAYRKGFLSGYRAHLRLEEQRLATGAGGVGAAPTLSLWCFLPGAAMKTLVDLGVRSCLFASGTLSPLPAMARELACPGGLSFPHRLENNHVIARERLWIGVVQCGPSGGRMLGDYQRRSDARYISDAGNALCNVARLCPGGVLVFFSSYSALEALRRAWEAPAPGGGPSVMHRLERHKEVFVEPRGAGSAEAFRSVLTAYRASCLQATVPDPITGIVGRGGLLLSVCRGKASEGMDFRDHEARCVCMVGIPYASTFEPRVRLQRDFLDETARADAAAARAAGRTATNDLLTGSEWYHTSAARAANQAVGRVVRHAEDWGAVVLLDERFGANPMRQSLSKWVQESLITHAKFGGALGSLAKFFKDRTTAGPSSSRPPPVGTEDALAGTFNLKRPRPSDMTASVASAPGAAAAIGVPLTQAQAMPMPKLRATEGSAANDRNPSLMEAVQRVRAERAAKATSEKPHSEPQEEKQIADAHKRREAEAARREAAAKNPALQLVAKMRRRLPPGVFLEIQELLRGLKAHTIHFKMLLKELARLLVDEATPATAAAGAGGSGAPSKCTSPYRDILGDLALFVQAGSSAETKLRAEAFSFFLANLDRGLGGQQAVKEAVSEVRRMHAAAAAAAAAAPRAEAAS